MNSGSAVARRVALVLAQLDEETAASTLQKLDRGSLRQVLLAVGQTTADWATPEEAAAACREVVQSVLSLQKSGAAGLGAADRGELARRILEVAPVSEEAKGGLRKEWGNQHLLEDIRATLGRLHPRVLARWCEKETAAPVATVLCLATPELAGATLSLLPVSARTRSVEAMVALNDVTDAALEDLAEVLRGLEKLNSGSTSQLGGREAVQAAMGKMDPHARTALLEKLQQADPGLAAELEKSLLSLEQLAGLSRKDLSILLSRVSDSTLTAALLKEKETLQKAFLESLPSSRRLQIKEDLEHAAPLRVSEKSQAQLDIVELARELQHQETIVFPWEGDWVE